MSEPDYTIKLYWTGLGWRFELTGSASDIEGRGQTVEGVTLAELLGDVAGIVNMDREARHEFEMARRATERFDEAMTALRRFGGKMSRPR